MASKPPDVRNGNRSFPALRERLTPESYLPRSKFVRSVVAADGTVSGPNADPCPEIVRQRLVVEGRYGITPPDAAFIECFLMDLSHRLAMRPLTDVLVFSPDHHSELHHGIAGFLPWVESGCSIYTWSDKRFFSLEIFSCKPFDKARCIEYTATGLKAYDLISRSL